ncbi:MAG: WYL domain-containing protein [Oscillospiraceae bacterium]|jgi:predicted DNA-binding transcriptional regulator YafY|nr:WYL domain-containing protein [Oscillospiraceae bacterium]
MPRYSSQKLKALYLARILLEQTDEKNVMSTTDLVRAMSVFDIPVERKSIYDDIEALRHYGMDIELRRGKKGGYFVASRDFELPELKLLVDAVQSSYLITGKKSRELIKKLSKLTSTEQAKQLNRQVHIQGRSKALNETVYYTIDSIHEAINEGKKISFKYFGYDIKKSRVYKGSEKVYIRTPVAMCWNNDNYYLVTYAPQFENPYATYRVDRMVDVKLTKEKAEKCNKETFKLSDYIKQNFGMFSGEMVKAMIAFDESLVSVVLDRFGSETHLMKHEDNKFTIRVNVSATPVFFGWIFSFRDQAEILEPESLREDMERMLKIGNSIYGDAQE